MIITRGSFNTGRQGQERGKDEEEGRGGGVTGRERWSSNSFLREKRNRRINKKPKPANESRYFKIYRQSPLSSKKRKVILLVTILSVGYKNRKQTEAGARRYLL